MENNRIRDVISDLFITNKVITNPPHLCWLKSSFEIWHRGDWDEMKQGQVVTVTITFMGDNVWLFTCNLVAQYNRPSYYHKTFENELKWKNLATKTVLCTHWINRPISKKWGNPFSYWAYPSIHVFIWKVLPSSSNERHYLAAHYFDWATTDK